MEQSIERFTLDLSKSASDIMIDVKKGDTYKQLLISLREGSKQFLLSENDSATLYAKLPGGGTASSSCTITDNTICPDIISELTSAIGIVECEIRLSYQDNSSQTQTLTTPSFYIRVNKSIEPVEA